MANITQKKVRNLTLSDMGVSEASEENSTESDESARAETAEAMQLDEANEVLIKVRAALKLGFAGVILSGPPGTGKSWYAKKIAETIAGNADFVQRVQFHPSYQYQDFMEGYVPTPSGSFILEEKVFSLLCKKAQGREATYVLVIDEISRCDVVRVFGEALTYLEKDKRETEFVLASGRLLSVPQNLTVIATMNPWDKGVDELDIALERRFAQIDIPPSAETLSELLKPKADGVFLERLITFFNAIQGLDQETLHLGHAYFLDCVDEETAKQVWDYRLQPFFKKACRLDNSTFQGIKRLWGRVVNPPPLASVPGEPPATGNGVATSQGE